MLGFFWCLAALWGCVFRACGSLALLRCRCCQVRSRRKREKAQKAYDYLMKKKGPEEWESSNRDFVKKHKKFPRAP